MGYAARSLGLRIYQYIVAPYTHSTNPGVDETFYYGQHDMTGVQQLFYSIQHKKAGAVDCNIYIKIDGTTLKTILVNNVGYLLADGYINTAAYADGIHNLEIYLNSPAGGSMSITNIGLHGILT